MLRRDPTEPPASGVWVQRAIWGALVAVLVGVGAAGVASITSKSPSLLDRLRRRDALPMLGTVPPFALIERSGQALRGDDLRGTAWIADFIFTRCGGVCPALSTRFAHVRRALDASGGQAIRLVSFSVDPDHDTPAVLQEYAQRYQASVTGWLFVTGERATLDQLIQDGFKLSVAQRAGTADQNPNELITHSDRFILVDADGRIRGYYRGTDEDIEDQLLRDVERLRREG